MSHPVGSLPLNPPDLLYVLVVERRYPRRGAKARGDGPDNWRNQMFARLGQPQPAQGAEAQGADVVARAVGALALAALAVIHVVDLPATLGPTPLVGIGYLGIIAAAVLAGGVMITRSHWLAWAAAGAVAVSAMGGYVLTRALPGGFLGDHGDVGNWRCSLGIAALSVETLIILLAAGAVLAAWQARARAASVAEAPRPAARRVPEYSQPR